MAKEEVKSVVFKNFTDSEFVCSWDGTPYRFAPGKEMYVEDWKAEHFAKHLVDKVMSKAGQITSNMHERSILLAQAMPTEEVLTAEEALDLNARKEIADAKENIKKGKTSKKVVEEEEFAGLNK